MDKYEYKIIYLECQRGTSKYNKPQEDKDLASVLEQLNLAGAEGWELVSSFPGTDYGYRYLIIHTLKRKLP